MPHDCREPVQYVFHARGKKLGVLSDAGAITPHMKRAYHHCHGLLLECNHDLAMLENGPYPPSLKRRVASNYGHLNNQQAASFLAEMSWSGLTQLVMTHISQKNNHPEKARDALVAAIQCDADWIKAASQTDGLEWHDL